MSVGEAILRAVLVLVGFLVRPGAGGLLLDHPVVADVVQIQRPGLLQGDLTDQTGRFHPACPAVSEPPHPPEPPLS